MDDSVWVVAIAAVLIVLILCVTSCEKKRMQTFKEGGYIEQVQPGTAQMSWVKPYACGCDSHLVLRKEK